MKIENLILNERMWMCKMRCSQRYREHRHVCRPTCVFWKLLSCYPQRVTFEVRRFSDGLWDPCCTPPSRCSYLPPDGDGYTDAPYKQQSSEADESRERTANLFSWNTDCLVATAVRMTHTVKLFPMNSTLSPDVAYIGYTILMLFHKCKVDRRMWWVHLISLTLTLPYSVMITGYRVV